MRKLWVFSAVFLLLGSLLAVGANPAGAAGRTFYVSPQGNDANPGTLARPYRTIQRAHDGAGPGDTIYVRGGVYYVDGYNNGRGVWITRSGASGQPIRLWAYPGERPIIDGSHWTAPGERYLVQISADWWHIRGLELRNLPMTAEPNSYIGLTCWDCNNSIFERLDIHNIQGSGLTVGNWSSGNLVLNVDSHHNYDPLTAGDPGGNADGIDVSFLQSGTSGNVVRGCRTWFNSDDGIDLWESESPVIVEGNWSFRNGYLPGTTTPAGNGNGFKLGRNFTGPRHTIRNNMAFLNRAWGFDENVAAGPQQWFNNTAYNNGSGAFRIVNGYAHLLRNNLAVPATLAIPAGPDVRFNNWTLAVTANNADFVTVDPTGTEGNRPAAGGLPQLSFLRLRAGSDLIDKGVVVGLPYRGKAPDLGANES